MPHITEEQWKDLLHYAKRQFVYDLLLGNLQNVKVIWERMEFIHISVMPKIALALRLDNYYALTYDKSERWKHQFRDDIWSFLEELFPDNVIGVPFEENLIALLVPLKTSTTAENRMELIQLITPWAKKIFDHFGIKIVFGLGGVYNDPRLLHFSFQESIRVLDHPESSGQDFRFAELPEAEVTLEPLLSLDPLQFWPEWAKSRVLRKLEMGDRHGVIQELKSALDKQLEQFLENDRKLLAPVVCLELVLAIQREVLSAGNSFGVYEEIAQYIASSEREEADQWLEKFGENLIHWAKTSRMNGFSENPSIARVKAYVEDHLEEELSLSHIAEFVHLAPSYLSQLFKKQTGEGLNDFVAERRINKACRILQTTSLSVSDIARKVGFQDVNYFTRVFKQRQHLTPIEFRKGAKQNG